MLRFLILLLALTTVSISHAASSAPRVILETSKGDITLELNNERAPLSVKKFLEMVQAGHYDNTIFHRVIADFMIQGGGFSPAMERKDGGESITNEADNGLLNSRGTVAMARTQDPHSASAQFFINLKDNLFLDHSEKTLRGWGYAVFGRVIQGLPVVDEIGATRTGTVNYMQDVPLEPVVILRAYVAEPKSP